MIAMVLRRFLITVPVLILISIVTFYLKEVLNTSIDQSVLEQTQVSTRVISKPSETVSSSIPSFYFSILPFNFPDSLSAIQEKSIQSRAIQFLRQGVRWHPLQLYLQAERKLFSGSDHPYLHEPLSILQTSDLNELKNIQMELSDSVNINVDYHAWSDQLTRLIRSKQMVTLMVPVIHWNGTSNGYHQWIKQILAGNWGVSIVDNRPAWAKVKEALSWTLSLNLLALILVYILAFLIGEYLFSRVGTRSARWFENILLFFHSIPRFFLAMILIIIFASNTVHPLLHILPTPGFIDLDPGASWIQKWTTYGGAMILPLICMILPALAYLSRLYASRLSEENTRPYAFLAWAKGTGNKIIIRKHLRKNAIIPLITLIGMEIPALIGGSVVIEVLFNIPGMGRLMMQSIVLQDWAIVFDILLLTGILTLSGKLLTDLFIRFFDPRIV